jgi:hypothetical protein
MVNAEVCKIAPIVIIEVPSRIVFFLPQISPTVKAMAAPKKHPTSYIATMIANVFVLDGPLRSRVSR